MEFSLVYSLVELSRASRGTNTLYAAFYFLGLVFHPENGGATYPRMVKACLPDCPASHPRRHLLRTLRFLPLYHEDANSLISVGDHSDDGVGERRILHFIFIIWSL
jgi:hypothetical protein